MVISRLHADGQVTYILGSCGWTGMHNYRKQLGNVTCLYPTVHIRRGAGQPFPRYAPTPFVEIYLITNMREATWSPSDPSTVLSPPCCSCCCVMGVPTISPASALHLGLERASSSSITVRDALLWFIWPRVRRLERPGVRRNFVFLLGGGVYTLYVYLQARSHNHDLYLYYILSICVRIHMYMCVYSYNSGTQKP